MSSFYALVGSAECWGIQILTIRYFNSFGFFWDTLYMYIIPHTYVQAANQYIRYFGRDYIQKPPPDFKTLCCS